MIQTTNARFRSFSLVVLCTVLLIAGCGGGGGSAPVVVEPAVPVGIDARPSNELCVAGEAPAQSSSYIQTNLYPDMPPVLKVTKLVQPPGDASRWILLDQAGAIFEFRPNAPAALKLWADLTDVVASLSNGGLLSIAFHPNYPTVPQAYVYYSSQVGEDISTRLDRLIIDETGDEPVVERNSLLTVDMVGELHHGGDLAFGPDGYLYLSVGESQQTSAVQDPSSLLGKMLRLDVGELLLGYDIPADNPFFGNSLCGPADNLQACPEMYAKGFRNPFRFSFDAEERLIVGDVGNATREELSIVEKNGNYGWPCFEGSVEFFKGGCPLEEEAASPLFDYSHNEGDYSITAGYDYRGTALPELAGRFVFGDFGSGRIWALQESDSEPAVAELLVATGGHIASFARGEDGEIYFANRVNGRIFRLSRAAADAGAGVQVPDNLSATGCVNMDNPTLPAEGVVPYAINAPFWSDGADKSRFMALPNSTTVSIDGEDDWQFPEGTVLVKNFERGGLMIETRLFMRHIGGDWAGYSYRWKADQSEAIRIQGGKTQIVSDGEPWIFPSEGQCLQCHTEVAGFALGPETGQLNRMFGYEYEVDTDEGPVTEIEVINAEQLHTLDHIRWFDSPLPDLSVLPAIAEPQGSGGLNSRARAWLHTNCAQCHRPGTFVPSTMDLRYSTLLSATNTCDVVPGDDLGLPDAKLIAPGSPESSVLVSRISRRDSFGMPPLGSVIPDDSGVALISEWVAGLEGCL